MIDDCSGEFRLHVGTMQKLDRLNKEIVVCRKCPRLVAWREKVARERVARFSDWTYWGKPVPGFGDHHARLLIVGLAPAAHGANRTGRMFTGDRSGEWLYGTLHKFGFANHPNSNSADDDLRLDDCYITAVARCAPPENKPTADELDSCSRYLREELSLFVNMKVIVALGKIAFDSVVDLLGELNMAHFERRPKFVHGGVYQTDGKVTLISSYHPSQQNTFTGKLTKQMFEGVFKKAKALLRY